MNNSGLQESIQKLLECPLDPVIQEEHFSKIRQDIEYYRLEYRTKYKTLSGFGIKQVLMNALTSFPNCQSIKKDIFKILSKIAFTFGRCGGDIYSGKCLSCQSNVVLSEESQKDIQDYIQIILADQFTETEPQDALIALRQFCVLFKDNQKLLLELGVIPKLLRLLDLDPNLYLDHVLNVFLVFLPIETIECAQEFLKPKLIAFLIRSDNIDSRVIMLLNGVCKWYPQELFDFPNFVETVVHYCLNTKAFLNTRTRCCSMLIYMANTLKPEATIKIKELIYKSSTDPFQELLEHFNKFPPFYRNHGCSFLDAFYDPEDDSKDSKDSKDSETCTSVKRYVLKMLIENPKNDDIQRHGQNVIQRLPLKTVL